MLTNTTNYTDANDFTIDNTKIEMDNLGAKLKDQRPSGATLYDNFSDVTANWGDGILTRNLYNGAIVDDGYLKFDETFGQGCDFSAISNADSSQIGCIRTKIIPKYSNLPVDNQSFFILAKSDVDTANALGLIHTTAGKLQFALRDENNIAYTVDFSLTQWLPVNGSEYELELNYDLTNGIIKLFINGVQFGNTLNIIITRSNDIGLLRIGTGIASSRKPLFWMSSLLIFSTVQHTSNYTPNQFISPTIYSTEAYDIIPNSYILLDNVYSIQQEATGNGIKYQIQVDGIRKYWDGSEWVISDGSYEQSNLFEDLSGLPSPVSSGVRFKLIPLLKSLTGSDTPILEYNVINYSFYAEQEIEIEKCTCYGYIKDFTDNIDNVEISIELNKTATTYKDRVFILSKIENIVITNNGYFEIDLVENTNMPNDIYYKMKINDRIYKIIVPNEISKNFADIVEAL